MKKSPKKHSTIQIEPLKGKFFDIKPAKKGKSSIQFRSKNDFFQFLILSIIIFLILGIGNAYFLGKDLLFESQEDAYSGYENIKLGIDHLLSKELSLAKNDFSNAENSFHQLSKGVDGIVSKKNNLLHEDLFLDTADKLIESALELSEMGKHLADLMQSTSDLSSLFHSLMQNEDELDVISVLKEHKKSFDEIKHLAVSIQQKLATINDVLLPNKLKNKIFLAREKIAKLIALFIDFDKDFDNLLVLLGDKIPHRYLILLQNNHELRATGGFIGSYIILNINDGKISKMESKDVYEADGQLVDFVEAPAGINKVADRWYLRDANYSPDFPTSAKKIMWFLEHSKQASVDTIIAIDQSVVEELLKLTGPLVLNNFPFQIKAENFNDIISFYTEAKLTGETTPKQLLFDLIPVLQKNLNHFDEIKRLFSTAISLVQSGHIQVYSSDEKIEKMISKFSLDGSLVKVGKKTDYLSIITSSIGGNKSDAYIKMNIEHKTILKKDGELEDQLSIKKAHRFLDEDENNIRKLIDRYGKGSVDSESLISILGKGDNLDYMRIYLPKGSELKSSKGIDLSVIQVSEDLNYTVFAFEYGPIKAGNEKEVILNYKLPFKLDLKAEDSYKFIAEHQAGAENQQLKKTLILGGALSVLEEFPSSNQPFGLHGFDENFNANKIFISRIKR